MKRRKSDYSSTSDSTSLNVSTKMMGFGRPRSSLCCLLLLFVAGFQVADALYEERCGTIDIRNTPSQIQLKGDINPNYLNCTIVEGSVFVTMIYPPENKTLTPEEKQFPRFEHLREITGFLLVFNANYLTNLTHIFPNLRVIGGDRNIQHYSLVVYMNPELTSIGLDNLRVIRQGGVRINENLNLCYASSIDWKHITTGTLNDVFVEDSNEMDMNFVICPNTCSEIENVSSVCRHVDKTTTHGREQITACWSGGACQKKCEHDRSETGGAGPGCPDGQPTVACHKECIGGCTEPDDDSKCYACQHIHHEGRCVPECPKGDFLFRERRCMSEMQCLNYPPYKPKPESHPGIPYKAVNGICHFQCPDNYEDVPGDRSQCRPCKGDCERVCAGNVTITSISDALKFKTCTNISGYLIIEIRNGMENVAPSMLSEAFGRIRYIDGYLVIRQCNFLINLSMFKSLTTITGHDLTSDTFALAIYENKNLRKLLDLSNRNFTIQRGFVQFYNNYQLCFKEIELFFEQMGRRDEMTDEHQSRTSNGVSKAICDEASFDVRVVDVSFNEIDLCWAMSDTTNMDHRKFLGYQLFYKKVPEVDLTMTIDDDRSACSDSWEQEFIHATTNETESDPRSNIQVCRKLTNDYISPDSTFAVYVQSSVAKHDGARVDTSKIIFVRTKFSAPDPPKYVNTKYLSEETASNTVQIEWGPSLRPNGEVTHYKIMIKDHKELLAEQQKGGCATTNYIATEEALKRAIATNGDMSGRSKPNARGGPSMVKEMLKGVDSQQSTASGCCACGAGSRERVPDGETPPIDSNPKEIHIPSDAPVRGKRSITAEPKSAQEKPSTTANVSKTVISPPKRKPPPARVTAAPGRKVYKTTTIATTTTTEATTTPTTDISAEDKTNATDAEWTTVNVTGLSHVFTGLKHYTSYRIGIAACQNVSVPEASCSSKTIFDHIHTAPIPEKDLVNPESIECEVVNKTYGIVRITWQAPMDPNGEVVAYRIRAQMADSNTGRTICKDANDTWNPIVDGVEIPLDDGMYSIYIQTQSLAGLSKEVVALDVCEVLAPRIHHARWFWAATSATMLLLIIVTPLIVQFVSTQLKLRLKDAATKLVSANPEYLTVDDIYQPDDWEVQFEKITIHDVIGTGSFGSVSRGMGENITSPDGDNFGPCAVKEVLEAKGNQPTELFIFLMEAQVMKSFKSAFIIKLLGVVSQGKRKMIIMEYMDNGNLRDYLRARRPEDHPIGEQLDPAYLTMWAGQVADGMAYLEWKQFCHRDVAARNILLTSDLTAKIGDFGMARDIFYHEYYRPGGRRMMPVRWMAPESLRDGRFDTKTDVWSYGIFLYEMLTFGSMPYPGLTNEDVVMFVTAQRRCMDRHRDINDYWWHLICCCWAEKGPERPGFREIVNHLADHVFQVDPTFQRRSFTFNPLPADEDRRLELTAQPKDKKNKENGGCYFSIDEYNKKQGLESVTTDVQDATVPTAAEVAAAVAADLQKPSTSKSSSSSSKKNSAGSSSRSSASTAPLVKQNDYNGFPPPVNAVAPPRNRAPRHADRGDRSRGGGSNNGEEQEMIAMGDMSSSSSSKNQ